MQNLLSASQARLRDDVNFGSGEELVVLGGQGRGDLPGQRGGSVALAREF